MNQQHNFWLPIAVLSNFQYLNVKARYIKIQIKVKVKNNYNSVIIFKIPYIIKENIKIVSHILQQ